MLNAVKHISAEADRAVLDILRRQGDLITRTQVLAAGWSEGTLRHRTRPDGPWRIVLPGIYVSHNGPVTGVQREIAAVLYAGRHCVITGQAALHRQGLPVPPAEARGQKPAAPASYLTGGDSVSPLGRGPKMRRSASSIGTSLMLASRRRM